MYISWELVDIKCFRYQWKVDSSNTSLWQRRCATKTWTFNWNQNGLWFFRPLKHRFVIHLTWNYIILFEYITTYWYSVVAFCFRNRKLPLKGNLIHSLDISQVICLFQKLSIKRHIFPQHIFLDIIHLCMYRYSQKILSF